MIIGVLGDTHVPGRARSVPPIVFETFRERGVELILCSGDINTLSTLKELRKLAPLYAVRGEIDFLNLPPPNTTNPERKPSAWDDGILEKLEEQVELNEIKLKNLLR